MNGFMYLLDREVGSKLPPGGGGDGQSCGKRCAWRREVSHRLLNAIFDDLSLSDYIVMRFLC